jgi:transaldolase
MQTDWQKNLKVQLYVDGADQGVIEKMAKLDWIIGFTTNPSLMRKSGSTNYKEFAQKSLQLIGDKPISFEIFADDHQGMIAQGLEIASWGKNIYVKIPVVNTKGESTAKVIKELSQKGIKLNVTAIFTVEQVQEVVSNLQSGVPSIVSVFAGRIADTGIDPMPIMAQAKKITKTLQGCELLWASPREVLNVFQANDVECDIITATPDILNKLNLTGKNLNEFSIETVQLFYEDAKAAGFVIEIDSNSNAN